MKIELQTVLKRELKSRHLTINGVAKSCKVPVSVLHSWINGVLPSAKNLHHVATLSKFLGLPVSVLLFNKSEASNESTILFNSEFADGDHQYRLSIVKVKKDD
jgi:transcriptional regulator with XRE-family HTH domain